LATVIAVVPFVVAAYPPTALEVHVMFALPPLAAVTVKVCGLSQFSALLAILTKPKVVVPVKTATVGSEETQATVTVVVGAELSLTVIKVLFSETVNDRVDLLRITPALLDATVVDEEAPLYSPAVTIPLASVVEA